VNLGWSVPLTQQLPSGRRAPETASWIKTASLDCRHAGALTDRPFTHPVERTFVSTANCSNPNLGRRGVFARVSTTFKSADQVELHFFVPTIDKPMLGH
jgi:hypothetical protein